MVLGKYFVIAKKRNLYDEGKTQDICLPIIEYSLEKHGKDDKFSATMNAHNNEVITLKVRASLDNKDTRKELKTIFDSYFLPKKCIEPKSRIKLIFTYDDNKSTTEYYHELTSKDNAFVSSIEMENNYATILFTLSKVGLIDSTDAVNIRTDKRKFVAQRVKMKV